MYDGACHPHLILGWRLASGLVRNHIRRCGIVRLLKQCIVNSFNALFFSTFFEPVARLWGFFVLASSNITWNYRVPITNMSNSMPISLDLSALRQKLPNPETRAVKLLILKNSSGCLKGKKVLTKTRLFASRPIIWYTAPAWFPFTATQVQCPCPRFVVYPSETDSVCYVTNKFYQENVVNSGNTFSRVISNYALGAIALSPLYLLPRLLGASPG